MNPLKYKGIPYLDVTTVYSKQTGTVFINVVNRHEKKDITADILSNSNEFKGNAEASVMISILKETYAYDKQEQYKPVVREIKTDKNKVTFTFPAHSFTQLMVKME